MAQIQTWKPENTVKLKAKQDKDGLTTVSALISHPMDSGFAFTPTFVPIPAHFIETLTVWNGDEPIMRANWGPGVAKDPFLSFKTENAKRGDKLKLHWKDNKGMSDSGACTVE